MKCPQCGFVSSNKRDLCPKCSLDLRSHKRSLGLEISYPSLSVDELRSRETNPPASQPKPHTTPQPPSPPVSSSNGPPTPQKSASSGSFLNRIFGKEPQNVAPPVQAFKNSPPPPQPKDRLLLAVEPSEREAKEVVKPLASPVLEEVLQGITRNSGVGIPQSGFEVTQPVAPTKDATPLVEEDVTRSGASGSLPMVDFSDPYDFEKIIAQLDSGETDAQEEAPRIDIWGEDHSEDNDNSESSEASSVAPMVLDFENDESLLEKLDEMLGDSDLAVTSIKEERPKYAAQTAEAESEDFDISFELSDDDELQELSPETVKASSAPEVFEEESSESPTELPPPPLGTSALQESEIIKQLLALVTEAYGVSEADVLRKIGVNAPAQPEEEIVVAPPKVETEEESDLSSELEIVEEFEESVVIEEPLAAEAPLEEETVIEEPPPNTSSEEVLDLKEFPEFLIDDALLVEVEPLPKPEEQKKNDPEPVVEAVPESALLSQEPSAFPAGLWREVERALLEHVAAEVEIDFGNVVMRKPNSTLDMYFALVDEELSEPSRKRSLAAVVVAPEEKKIDTHDLSAALRTFKKEEKQLQETGRVGTDMVVSAAAEKEIPSYLKPSALPVRAVAALVDWTVSFLLGVTIAVCLFFPADIRSAILAFRMPDPIMLFPLLPSVVVCAIVSWLVLTTMALAGKSQTFGQQLLHINVTDLQGEPLSLSNALLWALLQFTTLLSGGLGLLPALSRTRRTLHDRLAHCIVAKFDAEAFFAESTPRNPTEPQG